MTESHKLNTELPQELAALRERIQALEASERLAKEKAERLESLITQVPLCILECNLDGIITFVSQREQPIGNWHAQDTLGTHIWDRMEPGPIKDALPQMLRSLAIEGTTPEPYISRHFSKTDEPIVIRTDWRYKRDANGVVVGYVCILSDITLQNQAEEALKQAHTELEIKVQERTAAFLKTNERLAIFQRFADASEQGFGIADLNGVISYVNRAMCHILGEAHPDTVIGRHIHEYAPIGEDFVSASQYLSTVLEQGRWVKEGCVLTRQGRLASVHRCGFLIRDEKGQPAYVAEVLTDITDRKQAEELLKKEHRTLRHLLRSSDYERGQIAYQIHDDLAQELAGAIMQLDTARHLNNTGSKATAEKTFDKALAMLRKAHYETRRIINRVRPPILDESGVVQAITHLVHEENRRGTPHIAFKHSVQFERLTPALENAVYRITHESLLNAIKHSQSERIYIELIEEGETLQICVQDWGKGFELTGDDTERFGLNGIRERARLLGGACTIESNPNQGTCVTVRLPLTLAE